MRLFAGQIHPTGMTYLFARPYLAESN